MRRTLAALAACLFTLAPTLPVRASEGDSMPGDSVPGDSMLGDGATVAFEEWGELTLGAEIKTAFRYTDPERFRLAVPGFDEVPGGVFLEPPSSEASLEVAQVRLTAGVELSPHIEAFTAVHVWDLYAYNPTSNDRVLVREAWLQLGERADALEPADGTTAFVQIGRSARFTKQRFRNLEGYGLWGTAISRFEQDQVLLGGTVGEHVYWRAHVANGNPLFFRDPGVLAGDNGTPARTNGDVPEYGSGFPILYDAFPTDVNLDGELELGAGLGLRLVDGEGRDGVDVLGWYVQRRLADAVDLDGTEYEGDLDILDDPFGNGLPASGHTKREAGVNLEARLGGLRVFGQAIHQDIADLERHGVELEVAYRHLTNGLFASGDVSVLNWVQPVLRWSYIDNKFRPVGPFVTPSAAWDWHKYDVGVRLGIVRGVDLTVEYTRQDLELFNDDEIHLDEVLSTLTVRM